MGYYYDGTKILNLSDLDGKKPEIYIVSGNRTAGKTVYFARYLVNRFLKHGEKFCLLYRYGYDLTNVADMFFKDIKGLFFSEYVMTSKTFDKGLYAELYLNDIPCGYALPLNSAEGIKRRSHLFSDVDNMFFDEFQSETGRYCTDEIYKFQSVHVSIARGGGKTTRRVPVFLCSNNITLINPYYIALGIADRLHSNTKFLRGHGWVMEQTFNDTAAQAMKESAFFKAFSGSNYTDYAAENVYLHDNTAFIERPTGTSHYLATLIFDGTSYGVREYSEKNLIFVDNKSDESYTYKIAVTSNDHNAGLVLRSNNLIYNALSDAYEKGLVRFRNARAKSAFIAYLGSRFA